MSATTGGKKLEWSVDVAGDGGEARKVVEKGTDTKGE